MTDITDPRIIPYLKFLGVDYIIFHAGEYGKIYDPYPDNPLPVEQNLPLGINYDKINLKLDVVARFEKDYVYHIREENP